MPRLGAVSGEGNGPGEASNLLEVTGLGRGSGRIQTSPPASGWGICNCWALPPPAGGNCICIRTQKPLLDFPGTVQGHIPFEWANLEKRKSSP